MYSITNTLFVLVLSLLTCALPSRSYGQVDSILSLPEADRQMALGSVFGDIGRDYHGGASKKLEDLQHAFEKKKEEDLALLCLLQQLRLFPATTQQETDAKEQFLLNAMHEAQRKGLKRREAELLLYGGTNDAYCGRWGKGFERMMKGYAMLKEYGWHSPFQKVQDLELMGDSFYAFSDYESTIRFLQEAQTVKLPVQTESFPRNGLNNLGLCFMNLEQYDSAAYYLRLAVQAAETGRDSFWIGLTKGNLGHVYYKMGRYKDAWPLIETDFKEGIRMKQPGSASNAAQTLATMALYEGRIAEAEAYMDYAAKNKITYQLEGLIAFFSNQYAYTRLKGDYGKAVQYADSLNHYTQILEEGRDKKILEHAKLQVQVDKYNTDIQLLENERARQVLMRNAMLVILLLSALLAITWIRRIQYQRKKEAELSLIKEKNAEEQLLHARNELSTYTHALVEKNELIQAFKTEIEQLQQSGSMEHDERMSRMVDLTNSSILTDDDWRRFRDLFDQVYPGFFIRLKEKMPDLTPSEIRLLALTKLQITPRDMAGMLGISADSIKKTRHRLRRKINLPEDGSLDEVVAMI